MPTVATYYQLQDDLVNVTSSLTLTQNITVTPAGGEGALVTWFAGTAAPGSSTTATYTVTLNGTLIGSYEVSGYYAFVPDRIPVQEAIATNVVKHGSGAAGNNVLIFTKTGGGATLTLSAVMLWHRVNV
jgi:hypothetical protein